jgi:hypothetical protein
MTCSDSARSRPSVRRASTTPEAAPGVTAGRSSDTRSSRDLGVFLLALIGDSWINAATKDGRRRLDNPADFVRLEIESALSRSIPVVPVLLDQATMPSEDELPRSLKPLAYRHAAELRSGRDLRHHIDELIEGLEKHLQAGRRANPRPAAGQAEQKPRAAAKPASHETTKRTAPRKEEQTAEPDNSRKLLIILAALTFVIVFIIIIINHRS